MNSVSPTSNYSINTRGRAQSIALSEDARAYGDAKQSYESRKPYENIDLNTYHLYHDE